MGKYSIRKHTELDLREIFIYGFESFDLQQAVQFQDLITVFSTFKLESVAQVGSPAKCVT